LILAKTEHFLSYVLKFKNYGAGKLLLRVGNTERMVLAWQVKREGGRRRICILMSIPSLALSATTSPVVLTTYWLGLSVLIGWVTPEHKNKVQEFISN
jgi:hypothetical protein